MVKSKKSKKPLIAAGALLVLGAIGATIAYNAATHQFNNDFPLGYFKTETTENFTSPSGWTPCTETPKIFTVKNKGNVPVKVRVGVEEFWQAANGGHLSSFHGGVKVALVNYSETDKWELSDGYYYAKNLLQPGEELEFMHSVTMNCDVDFGFMQTCTEDPSNSSSNCNNNGKESPYNGAEYHLNVTAQYLQDDESIAWNDVYPIVPDEDDWVDPTTFATLKSSLIGTLRGSVTHGGSPVAFKRSQVLETDTSIMTDGRLTTISTDDSPYEAFAWHDTRDNTLYWYSAADALTLYATDSLSGLITGWTLRDISGFRDFDMSKVTNSPSWFSSENIVDDWSPISHWNFAALTGLYGGVFNAGYSVYDENNNYVGYEYFWKDWSFAKYWKTPNLQYLGGTFTGNPNITSLKDIANIDVSRVTSFSGNFGGLSSLQNLDGLEKWDVSSMQYADGLFSGLTNLSDISALSAWSSKLSNLSSSAGMFSGCSSIVDLSPLSNWQTPNLTNANGMFSGMTKLKDISALEDWDVSKVTNFSYMFSGDGFTSVSPLKNWAVNNGTNFSQMFSGVKVTDASLLNNWSVSSEATTAKMFDRNLQSYPTWY
ncbi:BsaA family SipW-dependent biofilm matrix protein [Candidatus Saccharibacteria bacterium]|nr:BsaA family SipW-dependent biofilm matrix protein [Candidatus Saccharibacteria bacterium]